MRPLLAALALLLALAPACDVTEEPSRLEGLADNECGDTARCLVECGADPSAECTSECAPVACGPEGLCGSLDSCDRDCGMMVQDLRGAAETVQGFCRDGAHDPNGRPYTADDCKAVISSCDDVADPVAP